ncbi:MAG: DUF305 domain-containing protein [Bacteroidota bacterium]|nr:DUF305 domain-containing protein [Bacteroidota bacterium]
MESHEKMKVGEKMKSQSGNSHYKQLAIMMLVSFVAMYFLMYAMVDSFSNVYSSFNQVYMAGLMTAPMLIIELLVMGSMYANKKRNMLLLGIGGLALIVFFICIRQQVLVSDKQFLRSMIPHHAGALLMCQKASIHDPEIKELCRTILLGQQSEIDLMKKKLGEVK